MALLLYLIALPVQADTPAKQDNPQKIPFLTYHLSEPFIVAPDTKIGLTYELAKVLSQRSEGRYEFEVVRLSRPELNKRLNKESQVVIPWSNPTWFKDIKQTKYLWTPGYMEDSNSLISPINKPIEYDGPASLKGLAVSGQEGGRWVGLDPLVEEGQIKRVNAMNYWQAMRFVIAGKADVALIPTPMAKYLLAHRQLIGKVYFSSKPHSQFLRHLLIKDDTAVHDYLNSQVSYLQSSREWKAILARYGL